MPRLRIGAHGCAIRINCGWVHGETHATFGTLVAIVREWSAGDYCGIITPGTVYLRPLFNLQLMFQIAINPRQ